MRRVRRSTACTWSWAVARPDKLSFGWEKLESLLREPNLRDLLTTYWQELSPVKHIPLDIDWAHFLQQEQAGIYRVWAARVNGTLAGFVSFYVRPWPYNRRVLVAIDGGHFLAPAFRATSSMVGIRMWRSAIAALKKEEVELAFLHDNSLRPLSPFFLAVGARPFSSMWFLDLRDE